MSLYKNIGPITYLFETDKTEVFATESCYVLQIKNTNNANNKKIIEMLESIAMRFNERLGNNKWVRVYS
jgi:hypothetical protein